jgi:hypothetical protein
MQKSIFKVICFYDGTVLLEFQPLRISHINHLKSDGNYVPPTLSVHFKYYLDELRL